MMKNEAKELAWLYVIGIIAVLAIATLVPSSRLRDAALAGLVVAYGSVVWNVVVEAKKRG